VSFIPASISTLDILLVVILSLFAIRGGLCGFEQEASSFIALVLAIIFASNFSVYLLDYLYLYIGTIAWAYNIAYMGILLITYVLANIACTLLQSLIKMRSAPWFTYLGGAVLGFAKGLLLSSIAVVFLQGYFGDMPFMRSSSLTPYVAQVSSLFKEYLPYLTQIQSEYEVTIYE